MIPKLSGLNCPSCGAALEIRSFGNALNVVCPNCLAVLDAKDPNLRILQQAQVQKKVVPLIPLGTRGTLQGAKYEAIGFQIREVADEEAAFQWQEYLLFNPYHGFRYLTYYNGHWNFVRTQHELPEPVFGTQVRFKGEIYKRFSGAKASTTYVIGEFPWQVRVGETVQVADYVHVPRGLFSETTEEETVWSLGEYMTGLEVWKAFALPGKPPAAFGVFENQPSPYKDSVGSLWLHGFKLLAAAAVLAIALPGVFGGKQTLAQSFNLASEEAVSAPFEVGGHLSNLQVITHNDRDESVYLLYSLVDQRTGTAKSFGRELYRDDTATIPSVPAGSYRLRIQPDHYPALFEIKARRGVASMSFFWITSVLLLLPPVARTWRKYSFERARWQESGG